MTKREPISPRILTLLLSYFAVTLVFAGELLIPGRSLFRWDTLIYTWPMVQEARAQILAGHWPFWASSFCCGTPLLENINAGVFYPMKLLVYFLPLKFGYQLFLFAHVWLTFLFMHLFLQRGLKLRATAAIIGALAFGASGYMRSMWDTHNFYAIPWIPLALWIAVADTTARRRILAMAGCFVMLIYGGDLEQAILTVPAIFLLILFRWNSTTDHTDVAGVSASKKSFFKSVFSVSSVVLFGILLGLMLSAPQLLPAWDWSHYSYRAAGLPFAEAAERSFHPAHLIELIAPHFYGTRDGWFGDHLAYGSKTTPWVSSFHIGLVPFLLAMFAGAAALSERLRKKTALAERGCILWALALFVGGVILAIGGFIPPLFKLVHSLPLIGSFRYPEKYLLWATLGLATLAAIGTEYFLGGPAVRRLFSGRPDGRDTTSRFKFALFALCLISVLLPWYKELPTTNKFDPLETPQFLIPIINSDDPQGRIFVDPAVKDVPLPPYFSSLRPSEKQAIYYREHLEYNSPRLWGCRTAGGFSPAESAAMQKWRAPATNAALLSAFCSHNGVHWLVTTPERLGDKKAVWPTFKAKIIAAWGSPGRILLAGLSNSEVNVGAPLSGPLSGSFSRSQELCRLSSDTLRISLTNTSWPWMTVCEGDAIGWRGVDQRGGEIIRTLTNRVGGAQITFKVSPDATEIHLSYAPPMWRRSPFVALAGLIVTIVLWWPAHSMRGIVARSATTTFVCCLAFVVISLAARSHWSCTFDEGFHLTRGLALRHFHDARLSFFHPPLQNSLGGYFANLAFGDRLKYPVTDALQRGDALTYATEFAKANGDVFNEAVRASRWAPMHFGMLLVAVGVWWGRKIGGDLAGWLAGIGLALNPNLIAHANLNTTDIGVTALAIAGTALLWRAGQKQSLFSLAFTVIVFALASMTKFTGLIWLGSLLVLVVPLLTWRWRDGRALLAIPVGLAAFVILLFVFYGSPDRFFAGLTAQTSHAFSGHKAWFHGQFFGQSSWWHLPAAVILKSPEVWLIAVVLALVLFVVGARERRRTERGSRAAATNEWLPFVPAIVFAFLLFFVNNMAIGVRHALPLIALGTIAGAVAIAKIGVERWRKAAAGIFAGGMIFSAGISFPNYIAYFPAWAGGTENGFRWLVDSNYDWGQGLDELEEKWAALTEENGGQSPNLIYYGFSDPRVTHKLRVGPNSYCGFMDAISSTNLNERVNGAKGILVVSISAPPLRPHGLDFKILRDAEFVRRIGPSFEVFRLK